MPIEQVIERLKVLDSTEGFVREHEMHNVADAVDWIEKTLIGGYTPPVAPPADPIPTPEAPKASK